MKKITYGLLALSLFLASPITNANAQVNIGIGIGLPNLSIGINLPMFPELVPVPGYPVYYAPEVNGNYFFYDGMYWVYQNDNWYASSWYNGPWGFVEPEVVPSFVLRVPVRYYRQPPMYFRGWQSNAPPRWGQHWGNGWAQHRRGWDRWNKRSVPSRAPRPAYQRQYAGDRYPGVEQQHHLRGQQYRYAPRDKAVREHLNRPVEQQQAPGQRGRQQEPHRSGQPQQGAPPDQHSQPPQRGGEHVQGNAPERVNSQQRNPAVQEQRPQREQREQREQQAPRAQQQEQRQQERGGNQEQGHGNGQGRDRDEDRGRGRER